MGVIAAPREHATTRPSPQTPGFQGRASPFYDHPEVKGHELMVPYEYNGSFLGLVTLGNSRQPRNGDSIGTRREKHRAQAVDEMKSSTNTKHETEEKQQARNKLYWATSSSQRWISVRLEVAETRGKMGPCASTYEDSIAKRASCGS